MVRAGGRRTVVIADPHPLWLDALETLFARMELDTVGRATSLVQALSVLSARSPDLVVAEIHGDPALAPNDFLRQARARVHGGRIVVLSAAADRDSVNSALAAGAVAYVVKTTDPADLAFAVRQAFNHSTFLADGSHHARHRPTPAQDHPLTRRELEILRLAADGRTNAELARTLWVTEQTVKFHLTNIYRKLGVANRTEASRWAERNGLLEEPVAT